MLFKPHIEPHLAFATNGTKNEEEKRYDKSQLQPESTKPTNDKSN
jgi:hypothetical protein